MSRSGTTQSAIRKRYRDRAKTTRLKIFLRRFGLAVLVLGGVGWLGAWFVLSGAPVSVADWTRQAFYDFSSKRGFVVENLLVEGRVNADPEILRALVDVERGDPIFAFNPHELQDLVMRISWVKSVRIERRLPGTIYIGLTERKPLALWQNKGKLRLIDDEGVTLTDENLDRFSKLLIIVGEDAPLHAKALVELMQDEPAIAREIEAAVWVGERRWDLKLRNGMMVKLPERNVEMALRTLMKAQEEGNLLEKDLTDIDLREPDRLTVRTRPGAVSEYKASFAAGGNDI